MMDEKRDERSEKKSHELWLGKLDAYLDSELDSGPMQELDRHLRECPACAAEALRRLQWKRAIQTAGERYTPDPVLRAKIQKAISPASTAWWHWRPAFAATAAALLLFSAARLIQLEVSHPKQQPVEESKLISDAAGELADLHIATLASANPVDVVSSDRHNVKPWFAGKIPFTFNLPDLQGTQFELLGGKVSYLGQSPGAQLLFRVRQHLISVFIFQSRTLPPAFGKPEEMDARSFHLESWQQNGLQYFAISDVAPGDLRALSSLLRK
jgi:anti-sigma factor RsiW